MELKNGLYIVATPIGDLQDITLRALDVLRQADAVICEQYREGSTLLKRLSIPVKELVELNEHNEKERSQEILIRLVQGQKLALISDCGTPVFSDPGHTLIREISSAGFPVIPIPGPSSLMAALSILDFKMERFVFGGFLPRVPAQRETELRRLRTLRMPIILMDTPYRLGALLEDISRAYGSGTPITLACDITLPSETILRGGVGQVRKQIGARKAEFILIVHA